MRAPAHFKRIREASRLGGDMAAGEACSAGAVFQDVGLVLGVFLGLALAITAALTAFGID